MKRPTFWMVVAPRSLVLFIQSLPKGTVRVTTKRSTLWMVAVPKPLVSVQSKSSKGECQSNNQTAYALDGCGSETSGVSPLRVANVSQVVNISLVGTTTPLVMYLYCYEKI